MHYSTESHSVIINCFYFYRNKNYAYLIPISINRLVDMCAHAPISVHMLL